MPFFPQDEDKPTIMKVLEEHDMQHQSLELNAVWHRVQIHETHRTHRNREQPTTTPHPSSSTSSQLRMGSQNQSVVKLTFRLCEAISTLASPKLTALQVLRAKRTFFKQICVHVKK